MKLSNMRIGTKLNLVLGTLLVVIAGMAATSLYELQRIQTATDVLTKEAIPEARLAATWYAHTQANGTRAYALAKIKNIDDIEFLKKEMAASSKVIDEAQKQFEEKADTQEEKALLANVAEKRKKYVANRIEVLAAAEASDNELVHKLAREKMLPALKTYLEVVSSVRLYQEKIIEEQTAVIEHAHQASTKILTAFGVLGFILGTILAWRLRVSITRPINEAVDAARTVASGDLTKNTATESTNETGILLQSLQEMTCNLLNTVKTVRQGTEAINVAATQISSGNQDLSFRTSTQASALEETSATMRELTVTVKKNSENAAEANKLAEVASNVAAKGGEVVAEVVDVMTDIEKSSKKIVDIISVIDGIAFQTNILALNAAVEAARAGEQGRGFAVVAAEVRSLAQRAASAAKEINGLINQSVGKVETGARLVNSAGTTMKDIVESIGRVTAIMTEIAEASREQSSSIDQVNEAIVQMDDMTQQNSALVEEAAAASIELQSQASSLREVVDKFKV